jgi:hypothetical protein
MHKNATKYNKTLSKWCKNKHGASKIIDTFETYQWLTSAPSSGNIYCRLGPCAGWCAFYGDFEETNHITLSCTLSKFIWSAAVDLLECSWNPSYFSISIGCCTIVWVEQNLFFRSIVRPFAICCGILEISFQLRDFFRHIGLMACI